MKLGPFELTRLFTSIQLLLIVAFLLSVKTDRIKNILLSIFLLAQAAFIFGGIFYGANHNLAETYLPVFYSLFPVTYLLGPAVYLYVRTLANKSPRLEKQDLSHAMLFLLMVILNPLILKIPSTDFFFFGSPSLSNGGTVIALLVLYIQVLVYFFASLRIIVRNNSNTDHFFNKARLRFFIGTIACLWLTECIVYVTFVSSDALLCWVLIVLALLQFTIANAMVFQGMKGFSLANAVPLRSNSPKYQKTMIPEQERARYVNRIREVMRDARPYLEPDFSLQQLSAATGIPVHHVSQVLNGVIEESFCDFVNRYRINESLRQLEGGKTILEILYAVGFTSKSAFNTAFKKQTGYTPTQYRKLQADEALYLNNSLENSTVS